MLLACGSAFAQIPSDLEGRVIVGIDITGNKRISTEKLLGTMKSAVGTPLSLAVINDDIKAIAALGGFNDIVIKARPEGEDVRLLLQLVEYPSIHQIYVQGNHKIKTKSLLKELSKFGIASDREFSPEKMNRGVKTLEQKYRDHSHYLAKVKWHRFTDETAHREVVEFRITEGPSIGIGAINLNGNTAFKDDVLRGLMKTCVRGWFKNYTSLTRPRLPLFSRGIYKEKVLNDDIKRIRDKYRRNGYINASVSAPRLTVDKHRRTLTINVDIAEGSRYMVKEIILTGNKRLKTAALLKLIEVNVPGKPYNPIAMEQRDLLAIGGAYRSRGYFYARVFPKTHIDEKNHLVSISYDIVEGELTTVDKILIRGNTITKEKVIRRELKLHPGEIYDESRLRTSIQKLYQTGFFRDVNVDFSEVERGQKINIIITVDEKPTTGTFSLGTVYSSLDSWLGYAELTKTNLGGLGRRINFKWERGVRKFNLLTEYHEPWINDKDIQGTFRLYNTTRQRYYWLYKPEVGYRYITRGGSIDLGTRHFNDFFHLFTKLTSEITTPYRLERPNTSGDWSDPPFFYRFPENMLSESQTSKTTSITLMGVYDTRNNPLLSSSGSKISASLEVASNIFDDFGLGGDTRFNKIMLEGATYHKNFNKWNLGIHAKYGYIRPLIEGVAVPPWETFLVGGVFSVRGYEEGEISEQLGRDIMLVINIEEIYPISDYVKAILFWDMGNAWASSAERTASWNSGSFLQTGFGFGFRLETAMGPIRFEMGARHKDGHIVWKQHFTIGQTF